MRKGIAVLAACAALACAGTATGAPPQGYQSDTAFAQSYAKAGVVSSVPTEQQTSCYTPEVVYFDSLTALEGYPDGGMSPCNGAATTGENLGPYATQDKTQANPMRVKVKSGPTCEWQTRFDCMCDTCLRTSASAVHNGNLGDRSFA